MFYNMINRFVMCISGNNTSGKVTEEVNRSLEFLSVTTTWRSKAQYLVEIDLLDAGNYMRDMMSQNGGSNHLSIWCGPRRDVFSKIFEFPL